MTGVAVTFDEKKAVLVWLVVMVSFQVRDVKPTAEIANCQVPGAPVRVT